MRPTQKHSHKHLKVKNKTDCSSAPRQTYNIWRTFFNAHPKMPGALASIARRAERHRRYTPFYQQILRNAEYFNGFTRVGLCTIYFYDVLLDPAISRTIRQKKRISGCAVGIRSPISWLPSRSSTMRAGRRVSALGIWPARLPSKNVAA